MASDLPVDGSPLVLVTPSLHLKLDDVVRGVSREAERLWLGDRRDDEHLVFEEVAKVATVEQVSETNRKRSDVLLVGSEDVLPEDVSCDGVHLPQSNTDSAENLVDFW